MSAVNEKAQPRVRDDDPRVRRTRVAVLNAARGLFIQHGYAGVTMEEVAEAAGVAKRTLYNNYSDKAALFATMVEHTVAYAESFAQELNQTVFVGVTKANVSTSLETLGVRLAQAILRIEVISLRRMLIGESRDFPGIGADYFERAPGQVLQALATGFEALGRRRILRVRDPQSAATQFAYLIAGSHLDRALMTGEVPAQSVIDATARDGVTTFLARYGLT